MTSSRPGPIAMVACSLALVWPATCRSQHEILSATGDTGFDYQQWANVQLDTLDDLSVPALRSRRYQSRLKIEEQLGSENTSNEYSLRFSADGSAANRTVLPYEGDEHMFRGKRLEQAIDRDSDFFWRLMPPGH